MTTYADDSSTIVRFSRKSDDGFEHLPLSNFYPSPIAAPRGLVAPTVEHYFQAAKTTDKSAQAKILAAKSPGEAKRLGQKVVLRDDWDSMRLTVMRRALAKKFADPETGLGVWLARTDPCVLVEGNTWGDTFWGACQDTDTADDVDGSWVGENWLGTLLMARRAELIAALLETPARSFDDLVEPVEMVEVVEMVDVFGGRPRTPMGVIAEQLLAPLTGDPGRTGDSVAIQQEQAS